MLWRSVEYENASSTIFDIPLLSLRIAASLCRANIDELGKPQTTRLGMLLSVDGTRMTAEYLRAGIVLTRMQWK